MKFFATALVFLAVCCFVNCAVSSSKGTEKGSTKGSEKGKTTTMKAKPTTRPPPTTPSNPIISRLVALENTVNVLSKKLTETSNALVTINGALETINAKFNPTTLNREPQTCQDLQTLGYTKSGFFNVMGVSGVDSVYCDFTLPEGEGLQKLMGTVDVKSDPIYFFVTRNTFFAQLSTAIPFENELINVGGAMDITTGNFKAKQPGTYFFSFAGHVRFYESTATKLSASVVLFVNDSPTVTTLIEESNTVADQTIPFNLQATLNLKTDEVVYVQMLSSDELMVSQVTTDNHFSHFTGMLLTQEYQVLQKG